MNGSRSPRRARSPRLLAVVALACSAAFVPPSHAGTVTRCGPGGTVENAGNGWLLSRPDFPAGPSEVTLVASPAYDPNLIYASNGVSIVRSRDAGCGWRPVFTAPSSLPGGTAAITALGVPSSANSSAYLYAGITSTLAGVTQPVVAVSEDYGDTWKPGSGGLPNVGRIREIAVSPQVQLVAFAVVESALPSVVGGATLYSTSDAGGTWTQRTPTGASFAPRGLLVDPARQAALYALADGRAVRSLDNAETFAPTPGDPGTLSALAAAAGAGSVRLAGARDHGVARSDDGGSTWRRVRTPDTPVSVAMAPLQDVAAASGPSDTWLLLGNRAVDVTPADGGAPEQLAVTAPTPNGYAVTGVASGGVLRVNVGVGSAKPIPLPTTGRLRPILLMPATGVSQFPSLLLPQTLNVAMAAGETRTVPYRLLVPRTPTPVDVMFLVDSTSSYQPVIDGLRQAVARLVNALNGAGLDVRFGIGNFEDYPPPYGVATRTNVPYALRRRIGPGDASFAKAIESITAHDGTPDGGQSALTAIYQALTGAGETIRGRRVVEPGLDARFRPEAMKFVLTSTDTEPHYRGQRLTDPEGNPVVHPGPSYEDVIAALRSRGVRSVGIPVDPGDAYASAVKPLQRLARASGAFAPAGGVDCDGNGTIDVATAAPLVCEIAGASAGGEAANGLAAAVVGLVASVSDPKPVSLRVTRGADRARIVSRAVRTVDMHADNELDFDVRLSCPRAAARRYEVSLESATPARFLSGGAISLSCAGPPGVERALRDPAVVAEEAANPPRAASANALSEPHVNVNTNTNTNPNPNPNPNPHMQPVVNANVGVAFHQQQQLQVALARDAGGLEVEELAMSSRASPAPGLAFGGATAAMLAGASATALRRRRRTAYATVTARR